MNRLMIACLLLCAYTAPAQTNKNTQLVFEGDITSVTNAPAMVWITYRNIAGKYEFDSCKVKDGKFLFTRSLVQPVIAIIVNKGQSNDYYACYLVPGEVKMKAAGTFKNAVLTGTGASANADYQELAGEENLYVQKHNTIATGFGRYDAANKKHERKRQEAFDSLDLRRDETVYKKFILAHPASPVAVYALLQYAYNPPFEQRQDLHPAAIQQLLNSLSASERKWAAVVSLEEKLGYSTLTAIGNPAIDFSANDTLGNETHLSSFRGRYVLVDFWASWCAPCRAENPHVLAAYNRFKDKGFTVLGVSLDKQDARGAWLKAVRDDKLPWAQVSSLQGFESKPAVLYGIRSIPMNFLLDPSGKIIAKSLHGEALAKKLAELFPGTSDNQ